MRFVNANFKFNGMRKEQEFTIYPCKADSDLIQIQSDTRIAAVCFSTKTITLSKSFPRGAFIIHLKKELGATTFLLNDLELQTLKDMRDKIAGKTNSDGSFTIVG